MPHFPLYFENFVSIVRKKFTDICRSPDYRSVSFKLDDGKFYFVHFQECEQFIQSCVTSDMKSIFDRFMNAVCWSEDGQKMIDAKVYLKDVVEVWYSVKRSCWELVW